MAFSISNIANGRPNNVSSFNTSSVSPANGDVIIISIGSRLDGGTGGNIPTVSGLSLTWTSIATQNDAGGTQGVRVTIYRALVSGSPTGVIAVDFAGQQQTDSYYSVEEITGSDTRGTNAANTIVQEVGGNTVSGGSQSISLAGFSNTANIAYGAFLNAGGGSAVGSGFTSLAIVNTQFTTEFKINTTTVNYTYTGSNDSAGIAFETAIAVVLSTDDTAYFM